MKKTISLFALILLGWSVRAQLTVESSAQSGNWADYYVNEVLLGEGVTAFNITFITDSVQIGEFTSVNTGVNMPYGLILANGDVTSAVGPNSSTGTTGVVNGTSDPDLFLLSGDPIYDAAILEFDFVPTGDTLYFEYVFASEEYNEYVGGGVNDAFGFFLSGPGISGAYSNAAINLAIIPGNGTEVSINTVNLGSNSAYYVNNDSTGSAGGPIEYDGHTVVLTASAHVNCGDTYHIKLAVGDGGDPVLDSGVFLEGGSFRSNIIEVNIASVNGDSTINEGCGFAEILFVRDDTIDTSFCLITITGTATNGVDFTLLPDSIILLPGIFDTTVVIFPFFDAIPEGMEYVTISAINVTACNDTIISTGTLYFFDVPNLHFTSTPDSVIDCPLVDSIDIFCEVQSGGPPPYSYTWSNGMSGSVIRVPLADSFGIDTFIVEIKDSCELFSSFDTIYITRNYQSPPEPDVLNDSLVNCVGDSLLLVAGVLNGNGPFNYQWSTGSTDDSILVIVNGTTTIILTVTDVCGRTASDTTVLNVKVPRDYSIIMPDSLIFCVGSELNIDPVVSGGIRPYTFAWEATNPTFNETKEQSILINQDTVLHFWVRDDCGRIANDQTYVDAIIVDPLSVSLASQDALCAGSEFTLDPQESGGLQPYYYQWSTGNDTDTAIIFFANTSQNVSLTITDYCGHTDSASAFIFIPKFEPVKLLLGGSQNLCYGESYNIELLAYGGAGNYRYEWTSQNPALATERYEKVDSNHFLVVSKQNNIHYLKAIDVCGNTTIDTLIIDLKHCLFVPNVISPNNDGINETFYIENITNYEDAHLRIFNRWGLKVFEAMPYLNDWNAQDEASGTYFYILQSQNFPELRGDLTVFKD